MYWSDLINPCIKLEAAPGEMGSLTMYWRSWSKMGIGKPPAESIAAVEPAAVETLRPLDRQFTKGESGSTSLIILQIKFLFSLLCDEKGQGLLKDHTNIWKHKFIYIYMHICIYGHILEWESRKCCWTWMCNKNIIKSTCWQQFWVYICWYPC